MKFGEFLDEENYEFGNPNCKKELHVPAKDMDLVLAAHRWRLRVANDIKYKKGAFSGFKVLLVCSKEKIRQFAAVVRSGGGEFVEHQPPFLRRAVTGYGITHCFIETKVKLGHTDVETLKKAKIPIVLIMYLNIFLLQENLPPMSKYFASGE